MKKSISLIALLLSAMMVFSSCGPSGDDSQGQGGDADAQQTQSPGTTETAEATGDELANNPAAGAGNVLRYQNVSPNGVFNGILYSSTYDGYINSMVFDKLIRYEYGTMNFVPSLAKNWESDMENSVLTFELHEGVQIHKGYGELTAEDVAFTLSMIMHPQYDGTHYPYYENIVGAQDYKDGNAAIIEGIVLHTAAPDNPLPVTYVNEDNPYKITIYYDGLTQSNIHTYANYGSILPRVYYETTNYSDFVALNLAPVGTGPMEYVKYEVDQYVELDRFDDYFKGAAKLDKVLYICGLSDTNIPQLQTGALDIVDIRNIDDDWAQMEGVDFVDIVPVQGNSFAFIKFNCEDEVMSDVRVRQAMAYGFNRAEFVDIYTGGRSTLTYAMVPKNSPYYPDEDKMNDYAYDPDKAGELLDEAGWLMGDDGFRYKDGEKMVVYYTGIADNANDSMKTAMMIEDYKLIGIEMIPSYFDWATYMDLVKQDGHMMFGYAWTMGPDPYVSTSLVREGAVNNYDSRYSNERFEELVEAGRTAKTEEEAVEYFKEAYLILNEELPILFMNDYTNPWCINKRVKNVQIDTFINWTHNIVNIEIVG